MAFLYDSVVCNHAVSILFHSIDFLPDVRHKDMLQLLEKIPFSDPSALTSTYQTFGKQVYDVLHKVDVKKDDDPKPSDLRYICWEQTPLFCPESLHNEHGWFECNTLIAKMTTPCVVKLLLIEWLGIQICYLLHKQSLWCVYINVLSFLWCTAIMHITRICQWH